MERAGWDAAEVVGPPEAKATWFLLVRSLRGPGTGLSALGAGARRAFFFYLGEIFAESLTEEHAV